MNNHSIYSNEELENWTERLGLLEQEEYLVDKYIKNYGRLIEAGTGGGRIALEIHKKYPQLDIVAFDFVQDMIESAKAKSNKIDFMVNDASELSQFNNNSFDFAIYLQQIISLVPVELIPKVINESYRILKKDGIIIFSFLSYEGRKINPILSFLVNIFRIARGDKWEKQRLPWLKLSGKLNFNFLLKNQATTYWFYDKEIEMILENVGFTILEIKVDNMIYIVCKK